SLNQFALQSRRRITLVKENLAAVRPAPQNRLVVTNDPSTATFTGNVRLVIPHNPSEHLPHFIKNHCMFLLLDSTVRVTARDVFSVRMTNRRNNRDFCLKTGGNSVPLSRPEKQI